MHDLKFKTKIKNKNKQECYCIIGVRVYEPDKLIYCTAEQSYETIKHTTFKAIHLVFVCHHAHNIDPHFGKRFNFHLQWRGSEKNPTLFSH
jgi:hypothetical protein